MDPMLREQLRTCQWLSVCGVGIRTSHDVVVYNWCISMATLGSIWKFFIYKGWKR